MERDQTALTTGLQFLQCLALQFATRQVNPTLFTEWGKRSEKEEANRYYIVPF
jgi:hypothetical protein